MDIKERIDGLSEAEAVLLYYFVGASAICKSCPLQQDCFCGIEVTSCKERFLKWADGLRDRRADDGHKSED